MQDLISRLDAAVVRRREEGGPGESSVRRQPGGGPDISGLVVVVGELEHQAPGRHNFRYADLSHITLFPFYHVDLNRILGEIIKLSSYKMIFNKIFHIQDPGYFQQSRPQIAYHPHKVDSLAD